MYDGRDNALSPSLSLQRSGRRTFFYKDRFLKNGGYTNETHQKAVTHVCRGSPYRSCASCPPTSDARTCTCVCGHWGACTSCHRSPTARGGGILWISASALATRTLATWVLGPPASSPPLAPLVSGNARAKEVARCLGSGSVAYAQLRENVLPSHEAPPASLTWSVDSPA